MGLSPAQRTARCVEIAKGLTALPSHEAVFADQKLEATRETGILARTAASLRGQGVVPTEFLTHLATSVGVSWSEFNHRILPRLEELGWAQRKMVGGKVEGLHEHVDEVDAVLDKLGKEWERGPSDYDIASVNGLDLLTNKPATREAFVSEVGVKEPVAKDVIEFGLAGTYMAEHRDILWSPLFWHGAEKDITKFLDTHDASYFQTLGKVTSTLRATPGLPIDRVGTPTDFTDPVILAGFLPTVAVNTPAGKFTYAFPPQAEFSGGADGKSDLFEKARKIVGAVRHGQYNSDVSRIHSPLALLRKLREGSMKPHSQAIYQYGSLLTNGTVTITPIPYGGHVRYKVALIDNPENRRAADLAEMMLRGGEAVMGDITDPEIRVVFGSGLISGAAKQRLERRKAKVAATDELTQLAKAVRGVRY